MPWTPALLMTCSSTESLLIDPKCSIKSNYCTTRFRTVRGMITMLRRSSLMGSLMVLDSSPSSFLIAALPFISPRIESPSYHISS
ncbi:hypothetical protein F5B22DRAFT_424322 [Xylaria bambusicola]|uniref:uncharacterized protein n=1 Tax=Xylaria bambusicola TaxID=326684 RepID=UPI0020088AFF|nr:uncharacterized protein F5B22DRAFT_424322 [Xylaria bambusicola]KAI0508266.1 hypothetical protein F5B22DRAFT_424322 [Xylaria bambusicola]